MAQCKARDGTGESVVLAGISGQCEPGGFDRQLLPKVVGRSCTLLVSMSPREVHQTLDSSQFHLHELAVCKHNFLLKIPVGLVYKCTTTHSAICDSFIESQSSVPATSMQTSVLLPPPHSAGSRRLFPTLHRSLQHLQLWSELVASPSQPATFWP